MSSKRGRVPTKPPQKKPSLALKTSDPEVLAAQQGIEPLKSIDELKADFWPEEESIDDFIAAVRQWRREGQKKG